VRENQVTGHLTSISSKAERGFSPSLPAIVIAFVALLILFLWLNFILTQQIESTGRDIQEKTGELDALQRRQDALLWEISAAGSEQKMSEQAWALGYRLQTPIFLPVAQPLAQVTDEAAGSRWPLATPESAEEEGPEPPSSLWALLTQQFQDTELETAP
jgi:hypothetical protein